MTERVQIERVNAILEDADLSVAEKVQQLEDAGVQLGGADELNHYLQNPDELSVEYSHGKIIFAGDGMAHTGDGDYGYPFLWMENGDLHSFGGLGFFYPNKDFDAEEMIFFVVENAI